MASSADCPRCTGVEESLSHIFRDCQVARDTWRRLGVRAGRFFTLPFKDWLRTNATTRPPSPNAAPPWYLVFLGAIWNLWNSRNKFIFEARQVHPHQIAFWALAQARDTAGALHVGSIARIREPILVQWLPPPQGFFKLNSDGSLNHAAKNASAGGIIRDWEGNWVKGYTVNIDSTSIFAAELWGLREALKLCRDLGI